MHSLPLKATAERLNATSGCPGLIYRAPDPSQHIPLVSHPVGTGGAQSSSALLEHRPQLSPTSPLLGCHQKQELCAEQEHTTGTQEWVIHGLPLPSTNISQLNPPKLCTNPSFPPFLCAGSATPDPAPMLVQALKKDPSLGNIKWEKKAALSPKHRLHIAYIKYCSKMMMH